MIMKDLHSILFFYKFEFLKRTLSPNYPTPFSNTAVLTTIIIENVYSSTATLETTSFLALF